MQCNPFYNDCFGTVYANRSTELDYIETELVRNLCKDATRMPSYDESQDCLKQLTYCVFNVININRYKKEPKPGDKSVVTVNDPPPRPFIDISDVIYEYNRVSSYESSNQDASFSTAVGKNQFDVTYLKKLIDRTINSENIDRIKNKMKQDVSCRNLVDIKKEKELKRIDDLLLPGDLDKSTKDALIAKIQVAIKYTDEKNVNYLAAIKDVIDEYEKVNAATLMGTMVFTDTIAKFGTNRMMCVLESDAYLKGPNNFIDNMTFNNLKEMKVAANSITTNKLLIV